MGESAGTCIRDSHTIQCGDEAFTLRPDRAAFWGRAKTLIAADLHLGKSETLAAAGMPIPPGVLASDLSRLESAVTACKAERLLILGDLLHAPIGLTEGMIDQVATWQRSLGVPWEIVPGNHDRKLELVQDAWSLKVHRSVLLENGVGFTHDPADAQGSPQLAACAFVWSGHVHPVVRIRGFGDSLRLPAYIVAGRLGILPAFSRFTRGGPVHLDGGDAKAFAIAEGAVIDVQRMFSAP